MTGSAGSARARCPALCPALRCAPCCARIVRSYGRVRALGRVAALSRARAWALRCARGGRRRAHDTDAETGDHIFQVHRARHRSYGSRRNIRRPRRGYTHICRPRIGLLRIRRLSWPGRRWSQLR